MVSAHGFSGMDIRMTLLKVYLHRLPWVPGQSTSGHEIIDSVGKKMEVPVGLWYSLTVPSFLALSLCFLFAVAKFDCFSGPLFYACLIGSLFCLIHGWFVLPVIILISKAARKTVCKLKKMNEESSKCIDVGTRIRSGLMPLNLF